MATRTPDEARPAAAKMLLRLPRGLHEQLRLAADEQGVSANTLVVGLLAGGIGWTLDDPNNK